MSHQISKMVEALEVAWAGIQTEHPDVPDALVVVGPSGDRKRLKFGHWARDHWLTGPDAAPQHEVFISAERLERNAEEVFGTLLHEAAHALATARGIQDTTKGTQYHNKRFAALAEELGMKCEKHSAKGRGYAKTTPRDETLVKFVNEIHMLAATIVGFRYPPLVDKPVRDKHKAKVSSAKSQLRWLAGADPAALHAVLSELGIECPHCGKSIAKEGDK